MFEYLKEKHKVTIKIGQFVSHHIILLKSPYPNFNLRPVKEINSLNRLELAQSVLLTMPEDYLVGSYDRTELLNDMAMYIDKRIPQSYAKWAIRDHEKNPTKMVVKASDYGLIYHYQENEPKSKTTAAERKRNPIAKKVESNKISGKKEQPLSRNKKLTVTEQVKEANFVQLNSYLRDNGLHLDYEEYRATLYTMNGMTVYYQTKSGAIKKASQLFNVTQTNIKKHIDAMNIISERASKNGSSYKKEYGRQSAIANSQFKRRLERED